MTLSADHSSELTETRRRLAELEAAETERLRSEKAVQGALYRIAELASAAQDLQEFYRAIHAVVGELMHANNFYIALYDENRQLINWPYWADELDDDWPEANEWVEFGSHQARGTTGYLLRTGEPQLLSYERHNELIEQGEIELVGVLTEDSSWLGVPLKDESRTVGALVVQSYTKEVQYTDADKELLAFVGQHVGSALSRARAIEETRQRNAELAFINSVQSAIAGELDPQAIYDVLGDKLQEVFDAQVVDIGIYDELSGVLHFPYTIELGVRYPDEPMPLIGFRRHVIETREPLLLNEDLVAEGEKYGNPHVLTGQPTKSGIWMPVLGGDKAIGVISLQNVDREHAFTEADVELLATLTGSLSVALENAGLVEETQQRNAELALINSVQVAIAGELDLQAVYDLVGDRIKDVFDAQAVNILALDETTGLLHAPYLIERGERLQAEPFLPSGFSEHVLKTREPLLISENVPAEAERYGSTILAGEVPKSVLFVPLVTGSRATGVISLQNVDREYAFTDSDERLLVTLAGGLAAALENARLVHETRQRNAELALINSVQEALAGELELQAIYDVVGDKLQEVFDAQVVDIGIYDEASGLIHFPYAIERGVRYPDEPIELIGFRKHVMNVREPLLVNENVVAESARYGNPQVLTGDPAKSGLFVPLVTGGKSTGVISLQNIDREHAFTDADVRLLTTLAGSLSVALENARLVHETRQRNAELALINSVQEAIAGELDPQAMYDHIGDKLQEVFDAQVVSISVLNEATGLLDFPYVIERGERLHEDAIAVIGFRKHVLETREPLMLHESSPEVAEQYGNPYVLSGEPVRSAIFVPLIVGGRATGVISLQNVDRTHAFTDADQRLLTTLAGSLSVALENARLVHETRQRNAELALINSVQAALAGELELQAIYDVVGDKIQEVFDAQVVAIAIYDSATGLVHSPYAIERGVRYPDEPRPLGGPGFTSHVMKTGEPILINEGVISEGARLGIEMTVDGSGEMAKSVIFAPLTTGGRRTGVVSLQNLDREHAFTDSDLRLLATLAGSLSVALENARLVHETRQRNAELALINSVQAAIAGELEQQAIYDIVGDKIQEIFDAQVVDIGVFDFEAGITHYPYALERGVRMPGFEIPMLSSPTTRELLETKAPLLINDIEGWERERGEVIPVVSGEATLSMLVAPLTSGDEIRGRISLQNADRKNAFSENDVRLLTTLAGSLSVALENARLVHETRQRNAELAFINSVQAAIAGELDPQAIYDLVGDRLREIFDAQVVTISTLDEAAGLLHYPYMIERGERLAPEPRPLGGFAKHVLETRKPLLINEGVAEEAERYGSTVVAGDAPQSVLFVPLVTGGRPTGVVSLQNVDRENAFAESDERLLVTLAGSLGAALENARLVEQTEQRNAELALINSVQEAIAGELDPQAIYDLVGEKIREVFDAQAVIISTFEEATQLQRFPYIIERGERQHQEPIPVGGFTKHVLETREPLMLNEGVADVAERYGSAVVAGGEVAKSLLFVPLVTGGRANGVVSLQNVDREHAFTESDLRLLDTLAGSLSVALDNARLVDETRQRVAELGTVNSIGQALATQLELDRLIELVGDRLEGVFDADIVYVALHDEAAGCIDFAYYSEAGVREPQSSLKYGEGLTSRILDSREPLVLNRMEQYDEVASTRIGTPSLSFLGVPIFLGEKAIGVISVQSTREAGRFGDAETGLLATIAASLGVALQNARLFEEQREAERKYRELVEELPLTVYRDFPDVSATSEYISPRVESMFGYPPEAWMDSEFFPSVLHPEDRERVLAEQEEWLSGEVDRWTNDYRVLAADGRTVWVRDDAWIIKDDEGHPSRVHGFMIDVTEQTLAEQEIRRQKQYFESLVDVSPVAIVVMDADERVTGWNPAAAELFGWSTDEAIGKKIDELVLAPETREEGRDVTLEAIGTGRAQRIGRRTRKDGAVVDVELMLVPLEVDGRHVGFYAIYHDITELQRAREEAEAATQAKSAFLATMSHEIRTPMNAVIGMTDLLLGTDLSGEQREFAQVVHSSGDALLHVIDDILDYSKIEAGKLELEREPLDLRECVEGALEIVAPRASDKDIELGCLIDEDAPAGIVGDAARLRQVLLNLLSNAVKFTEQGEVVVHVDAEKARRGAYRLELAVRDTGIGIPPDRMDKLFTSFSQVDASTTRRYGGTGLGLAISKRLVELMDGTIEVESEQGKGSTFRISLTTHAAEVPAKISLDEALPHLAGKRVLVVDDNATNREIVSRHARSWGMEPVAFEFPAAALERVAAGERFDVAVLDMMMPDIDGIALAREIRLHRSERELPLLLLTSLGRLPHAKSTGAFAAQLPKPVKASQLYNALVRLLASDSEERGAAESAPDGKPATSVLRILLAEDNAVNQKVALRLLERLGYSADIAWNGIEAIEALDRRPYDVVLMDVQMPELDGLDATRRICERWPTQSRPRIIAMTANALPEDREACFAAGMDDYVAKPIRPDELAAALSRARRLGREDEMSPDEGVSFDDAAFASLRELGGDDFVAEVIDTFRADAPTLLATLRSALEEGNTDELRRAAHTLKSNGATLGAGDFSELCRGLEAKARSGDLEGAEDLVDRIERAYAAVEEALAALHPQPAA